MARCVILRCSDMGRGHVLRNPADCCTGSASARVPRWYEPVRGAAALFAAGAGRGARDDGYRVGARGCRRRAPIRRGRWARGRQVARGNRPLAIARMRARRAALSQLVPLGSTVTAFQLTISCAAVQCVAYGLRDPLRADRRIVAGRRRSSISSDDVLPEQLRTVHRCTPEQ